MRKVREAYAAGGFYPAEEEQLLSLLESLFIGIDREEKFSGAIVPHAGYIYSGRVAAMAYSKLKTFKTFVILGTDHYGIARRRPRIGEEDVWETPLGEVEVDTALREELADSGLFTVGEIPQEHSIEVQLPLLQYVFGQDFKILPIVVPPIQYQRIVEIAEFMAELYRKMRFGVISSTDMSHEHFATPKFVMERDRLAINAILKLNTPELLNLVFEGYTMCGPFGVAILLEMAKILQWKPIPLGYLTSYDVTGDSSYIVGYFSCGFEEVK